MVVRNAIARLDYPTLARAAVPPPAIPPRVHLERFPLDAKKR